ncbi:MAG: YtxH domain-containing protein [Nitrospiraceae bacterium]|nr:YtxH domain-containing protein [Nitrospiraceae bacterium]
MNNNEEGFSAGWVAMAFLLGGTIGAGLAVLLTPKTGPEVRGRIKEQVDTVRGSTFKVADEVRGKAGEMLDKGKDLIEQKKAVLGSAIEAGKGAMEREKSRLMERIRKEKQEKEAEEA